ncbi:hypothetical protein Mgra_00004716 [Meloidogyne graminicola]|uniref:7TM_GPCR_Srx domain-containing protein n=1 Tax=Meloidogyne graminicola TaxID=189291 RepID=A0A8S9ZRE2_9BILA|nr:hypothetical protein Mgra_00004716 [Meloidogyne graminicola]
MFYVGINDILCLFICGLLTGILALKGAVFCSYPNLIFISGVAGGVFWCNETISSILLALNRCLEISIPSFSDYLFFGYKTWIWLFIPFLYSLIDLIFKPVLFNGIYFSWFFNPNIGYIDDFGKIYYNHMITFNNIVVVTILPGSYILFIIILICKKSSIKFTNKSQKKIFIQVFFISSINIIAAIIYVYMQFIHINKYIIFIGMFGWFFTHGFKSIIYLLLNETIQNDFLKMIYLVISRFNRIASTTMNLNVI